MYKLSHSCIISLVFFFHKFLFCFDECHLSLCSLRMLNIFYLKDIFRLLCFHFISELISFFLNVVSYLPIHYLLAYIGWTFCFSISSIFISSFLLSILQTLQNFQIRTRSCISNSRLLFLRDTGNVESLVTKPIDNVTHVLTSRLCLLAYAFLI